jgi:hypothetical protein
MISVAGMKRTFKIISFCTVCEKGKTLKAQKHAQLFCFSSSINIIPHFQSVSFPPVCLSFRENKKNSVSRKKSAEAEASNFV